MAMKYVLKRVLDHEGFIREDTKQVLADITKNEYSEKLVTNNLRMASMLQQELILWKQIILIKNWRNL